MNTSRLSQIDSKENCYPPNNLNCSKPEIKNVDNGNKLFYIDLAIRIKLS